MSEIEFEQRLLIAGIFLWGLIVKGLLLGYQIDRDNAEERLTFGMLVWENSQKWRFLGSVWFLSGLAFIAPHEGFVKLQEFSMYDIPVGHLGTAGIGFMGDTIFLMLDDIQEWIKAKLGKDVKKEE